MVSLIACEGGVLATRSGIMKAGMALGLAKARTARSVASEKRMTKVLSSTASIPDIIEAIIWPILSCDAQRLIDATQSADVTGLPSCHLSPSRRMKV
ncbi:hypothetical protein D3C85_1200130 [compost metagenome]